MYFVEGFRSWVAVVRFISYFFSIGPLLRTLFSGWHRDTAGEKEEWWQRLILALIIGVIGFLIRIVVIVLGLFFLLMTVPLLPILLIVPIRFKYEELVRMGSIGKTWAYGSTYNLHRYGIALYKGHDKKLYEREATVAVLTRVLARDEQDNVLLVGEPGTGRETIVAQFAKNVHRGLVPPKLMNREVIEIPVADTPAETLKKMFAEAKRAGNIIVVLHEPEKYQGMLDELLPLLNASELQVIAVTSFGGYVSAWKERTDVMRYLERVEVPPLSASATLEFLRDYAKEHYARVQFGEGVFEEIVKRTDELFESKPQPEKSLDVLHNVVVNAKQVNVEDVDRLLSEQTGVPLGTIQRDEKEVLLHLEEALRAEIVGQEEAVHDVAAALRRARTAVGSKARPIGSFLFLGPTGSGKTHTAKILAKHYFGGAGEMVRFDMSEFALPETLGAFVERVALSIEERPFSLLFFDELEKADRTIWNTLLQVLDEGRLTTRAGHTTSFKNTIIIATSNAGTTLIQERPTTTKDELQKYLIDEHLFSPEFLNRFDDVVLFHPLTIDDAHKVTRLLLEELNARLSREREVSIEITDSLIASLVGSGFSAENGARALRRAVEEKVENAVADAILRDEAKPGSRLMLG